MVPQTAHYGFAARRGAAGGSQEGSSRCDRDGYSGVIPSAALAAPFRLVTHFCHGLSPFFVERKYSSWMSSGSDERHPQGLVVNLLFCGGFCCSAMRRLGARSRFSRWVRLPPRRTGHAAHEFRADGHEHDGPGAFDGQG